MVGVGSVGKSNLLRHLMLDDVQRYHMGQEEADTLMMVLIDPNNMLELACRSSSIRTSPAAGPVTKSSCTAFIKRSIHLLA